MEAWYHEQSLAYLREHGETASYDDFRDRFGVCADGVMIFTAWTDAYAELYG